MTLTEAVENVRRVCQAISIPVIADCETGFGNVVNTTRAVTDFIQAGAAGFFLEDQTFPKRCGFTKGVEVVPIAEACGKYRAARDARDALDPDVVLIARTDSRAAVGGGMAEVLKRCEAYLEAGADMLMVMALQSREEVRELRERFPEVLIYVNASAINPPLAHAEYAELDMTTYNVSIAKVAQLMMSNFLDDYRVRGADAYNAFLSASRSDQTQMFKYLELTGFPKVVELERRYLDAGAKYEGSLGVYDPRAGSGEPKPGK
jgi:2-methylisocitrate lyase-like PEP mutase family enzyme